MKKKKRPSARWPASQTILVALVATPFVLLIYSVIASTRYDREITAEVALCAGGMRGTRSRKARRHAP